MRAAIDHYRKKCIEEFVLQSEFESSEKKQYRHDMASDEQLSELDGGPLAINNNKKTSVFSNIEQGLRKNPHKAVIVCMYQPADHLSGLVPVDDAFQQKGGEDCLTLFYTQVHRAALILAAGLIANGVRPGSIIVTLIPNGGEYAVLF